MMKNKWLYLIFIFFLWGGEVAFAQSSGLFQSAPVFDDASDELWDLAWHARLADYGDQKSQFIIADAYEQGKGVERNMKKAVLFYEKAGHQGHLESMMRLGRLYGEGELVKKDEKKSFLWYEKAAKSGYTPAQLKMAELCQIKAFLDYPKAYYWLALALKSMFPQEKDLENVSPDLKKLAFQLTPEQHRQVQNELR